jgi:hypothetical protein
MDGSAKEISFDENGVCNFCRAAEVEWQKSLADRPNLPKWLERIKRDGKGKEYDCLIGLSGGVDSSTTLLKALEWGLKPLCFSMDNGWDDPRADENVKKLVAKTGVEWKLHVLDKDIFSDLQAAFIHAGLIDVEIPTDHTLMSLSFALAAKHGIKWIFSGGNTATESIMPRSWGADPWDLTHLKDVYKKMTGKNLKGVPMCGLAKWNYYRWIKGIKIFHPLDFIDYDRLTWEKKLVKDYGFTSTGDKHEENTYTKWYQNWYLYTLYGVDKRKPHYSSLIVSGQMTRKEARKRLEETPVYPKLGIEARVKKIPRREHSEFKQNHGFEIISKIIHTIKVWTRRFGV